MPKVQMVRQLAGAMGLFILPGILLAQDHLAEVRAAFDRQNYQAVVDQLQDQTLDQPEPARLLALAIYNLPDPHSALPALRRAHQLDPDNVDIIYALGDSLRIVGDLDGAKAMGDRLDSIGAEQAARLLMGAVAEDRDRLDEAEQNYRTAGHGPDTRLARLAVSALTDLLHRQARHTEAATVAESALARAPDRLSSAHFESMQPILPPAARALQSRIGYRMEYDDNVPQIPGDEGLTGVSDEAGLRHVLTADLGYRRPLSESLSLFAEGYFYQSLHQDSELDEFDYTRLNGLLGLGGSLSWGGWRLPLEVIWEGLDGDRYQTSVSVLPGVYWVPTEKWVLHLFGQLSRVDFVNPIRPSEDRGGDQWRAGLLVHGRPMDALELRLIGEYGSNDADGENWQLDEWRLYGLAEYRIMPHLRAGLALQYRERDFENIHDVFLVPRKDEVFDLFVSLSWQFGERWRARAQYSYQEQDSNIAFFSFDRNVYSIGLSWEF